MKGWIINLFWFAVFIFALWAVTFGLPSWEYKMDYGCWRDEMTEGVELNLASYSCQDLTMILVTYNTNPVKQIITCEKSGEVAEIEFTTNEIREELKERCMQW